MRVSRFCRSFSSSTLPVDAPISGQSSGSTTRTRASGSSTVSLSIVTTKSTSSSSSCVTARWSASRLPRFSGNSCSEIGSSAASTRNRSCTPFVEPSSITITCL